VSGRRFCPGAAPTTTSRSVLAGHSGCTRTRDCRSSC
jgi:hypothetical protein